LIRVRGKRRVWCIWRVKKSQVPGKRWAHVLGNHQSEKHPQERRANLAEKKKSIGGSDHLDIPQRIRKIERRKRM